MALNRSLQVTPVHDNRPPSVQPKGKSITRILKLTAGDVIVLLAEVYQVYEILDILYIDELVHSPDLHWIVRNRKGQLFEAKEASIRIRHRVSLRIPVPITIDRTSRGYRTIVEATVPINYKIHELSFLQSQKPDLFKKLELEHYL